MFGARAAALYGSRRLTADVDVTVVLDGRDVRELIVALSVEGLQLRIDDDEFIARARVLPLVHVSTAMPVDVVLGGPGLEQTFLERVETIDVLGVVVPVIRPTDLIVTKLLAGRPNDLDDAAAVIRARDDVDMGEVPLVVAAIVDALGEDDTAQSLAALERKLGRA